MTLKRVLRLALYAAVGAALLFLAWSGLVGGVNQLAESETAGQIAQTLLQLAFGFFSLLSLLTSFWAQRWNRLMLAGFTISVGLAAGLASVVWGGTSLLIGVLSGAAAFAVALLIAWLLRSAARGDAIRDVNLDRSDP